MPRANLIGKGSKETPEPEDEERIPPNPLGKEDRKAEDGLDLDEDGVNVKKRKVSKTAPSTTPPE